MADPDGRCESNFSLRFTCNCRNLLTLDQARSDVSIKHPDGPDPNWASGETLRDRLVGPRLRRSDDDIWFEREKTGEKQPVELRDRE